MKIDFEVQGGDFSNAGSASSKVKRMLKQINLDSSIIKKIAISLYEAEVNIVAHAYKGKIEVEISANKIEIILRDEGPGIEDIEKAMQNGYSTASPKVREMGFGAGMGLMNIKNNSDRFQINSIIGKGTTLSLTHFFN